MNKTALKFFLSCAAVAAVTALILLLLNFAGLLYISYDNGTAATRSSRRIIDLMHSAYDSGEDAAALLPEGAYVVNVGRGTAIDQDALIAALDSGHLAGAALDVVVPEPLPADHPLRKAKNLLLTPHVAGNMTLGYTCERNVALFCENLENYAAGRPLHHLVDRKKGY